MKLHFKTTPLLTESFFVLYFAGNFLLPKRHVNKSGSRILMLYKPKFCCNCAEMIGRVDWNILTSRRFCDVCAAENKRYDHLPRAVVAGGILSIMFGLGTLFGGSSPSGAPIQSLDRSPIQLKSERPSGRQSAPVFQDGNTTTVSSPGADANGRSETEEKNEEKTPARGKVYYCGALTKKGTPCSRKVKAAGTRCYQHEGKPLAADS